MQKFAFTLLLLVPALSFGMESKKRPAPAAEKDLYSFEPGRDSDGEPSKKKLKTEAKGTGKEEKKTEVAVEAEEENPREKLLKEVKAQSDKDEKGPQIRVEFTDSSGQPVKSSKYPLQASFFNDEKNV